jgi:protein-tyrosine phosphatase
VRGELQPESEFASGFLPGVEVICCPMNDVEGGPTPEEKLAAFKTAQTIVDRLAQGKRVLVTCVAGRNRSGLVNALVLILRRGVSGISATMRIQAARPLALTNQSFCQFLSKIPGKR